MSENKILVIDDDRFIVKTLSFLLKREGYKCVSVLDGEKAMDMIRKEHPDLIFLDLHLPGKSGYEISQEIKKDTTLNDVHIIVITSSIISEEPHKDGIFFAHEFMSKPFDPKRLLERVHEILD